VNKQSDAPRKNSGVRAVTGKPGINRVGATWTGSRWVGGSHFAVVEFPRGSDGRRRKKKTARFKTVSEAEARRAEWLRLKKDGIETPPDKVTLADLMRRYSERQRKADPSPTTKAREAEFRARIDRYLGGMRAQSVRSI